MWCIPEIDAEFVTRMSDVLEVYQRRYDPKEPVVALDERPTVLHGEKRPARPVRPGKERRYDYEYVRRGTANIFCIVEPKSGRHFSCATKNRKGRAFAEQLQRIAKAYKHARFIHLVLDNLNTHREQSLTTAFGEKRGLALARRFIFHHTPKHASWLNIAEIEASMISRESLGKLRIPTFIELRARVRSWNTQANSQKRRIRWSFDMNRAAEIFNLEQFNNLLTEH